MLTVTGGELLDARQWCARVLVAGFKAVMI
jgi:hypothetical protein